MANIEKKVLVPVKVKVNQAGYPEALCSYIKGDGQRGDLFLIDEDKTKDLGVYKVTTNVVESLGRVERSHVGVVSDVGDTLIPMENSDIIIARDNVFVAVSKEPTTLEVKNAIAARKSGDFSKVSELERDKNSILAQMSGEVVFADPFGEARAYKVKKGQDDIVLAETMSLPVSFISVDDNNIYSHTNVLNSSMKTVSYTGISNSKVDEVVAEVPKMEDVKIDLPAFKPVDKIEMPIDVRTDVSNVSEVSPIKEEKPVIDEKPVLDVVAPISPVLDTPIAPVSFGGSKPIFEDRKDDIINAVEREIVMPKREEIKEVVDVKDEINNTIPTYDKLFGSIEKTEPVPVVSEKPVLSSIDTKEVVKTDIDSVINSINEFKPNNIDAGLNSARSREKKISVSTSSSNDNNPVNQLDQINSMLERFVTNNPTDKLNAELRSSRNEIEKLRSDLKDAKSMINKLNTKCVDYQNESYALSASNKELKNKVMEYKAQNAEMREQVVTLEFKLSQMSAKLSQTYSLFTSVMGGDIQMSSMSEDFSKKVA